MGAKKLAGKSQEVINALIGGGRITDDPGTDILIRAFNEPFKILMRNSGLDANMFIKDVIAKPELGVDVNTGQVVNLKTSGIVDPARVVKEAIQNAVSIAGTAMTMGALVAEVPEKTPAAAPDMGGGMGMM